MSFSLAISEFTKYFSVPILLCLAEIAWIFMLPAILTMAFIINIRSEYWRNLSLIVKSQNIYAKEIENEHREPAAGSGTENILSDDQTYFIGNITYTGTSDQGLISKAAEYTHSGRECKDYEFKALLRRAVVEMQDYLFDKGKFKARIKFDSVCRDDQNIIDIRYEIIDGPNYVLNGITIYGNTISPADEILEALGLKVGQEITGDSLKQAKANLFGTLKYSNIFSHGKITKQIQ